MFVVQSIRLRFVYDETLRPTALRYAWSSSSTNERNGPALLLGTALEIQLTTESAVNLRAGDLTVRAFGRSMIARLTWYITQDVLRVL